MSDSVEVGTVKTHSTEKESSQLSEKTKATVVSDTKKTSKEDDLKKMPKPKVCFVMIGSVIRVYVCVCALMLLNDQKRKLFRANIVITYRLLCIHRN
ncbi:unnamed protein product [Anisakis simplex]|uniref:Ovule protein n=1 Tax=Anisakis simplex TaxID=6269 RepID=A0A0M3JI11_ANISI|nr:unnamed protein product [Anisakis simplex]